MTSKRMIVVYCALAFLAGITVIAAVGADWAKRYADMASSRDQAQAALDRCQERLDEERKEHKYDVDWTRWHYMDEICRLVHGEGVLGEVSLRGRRGGGITLGCGPWKNIDVQLWPPGGGSYDAAMERWNSRQKDNP